MSFAAQNLKYLRKQSGLTQAALADKLKIKRALLGAYEEGRAEPRLEVLKKICSLYKTTIDDFLLKAFTLTQGLDYVEKRRQLKLEKTSNLIYFVPIKAAAGYLSGYANDEFLDELNSFTLPMLAGNNYRAFEIVGDSMLPTPSGSVIVGQRVEQLSETKNNHTYIVVSKREGIVYKRIVKTNRYPNKLTLVSDNPNYKPYIIEANDIAEIWQAQLIVTKANTQTAWNVNQLTDMVQVLQEQVSNIKRKPN